jgi:hypothetical protein
MAVVNSKRVWLGTLAGGVAFTLWSMLLNIVILGEKYEAAQKAGMFLQPRYPFLPIWILTLFILACIAAWVYAGVRGTYGPGPGTAIKVGLAVGFAAAFPINFSVSTWLPVDRIFPLHWMIELWVGTVIAAFIAGWLYKDA